MTYERRTQISKYHVTQINKQVRRKNSVSAQEAKNRRSDEATSRRIEALKKQKFVERGLYGGNDEARAVSTDFYVAQVDARVAASLKRKIVASNSRNSDRRRRQRAISRGKNDREPRLHTLSFLIQLYNFKDKLLRKTNFFTIRESCE